MAEKKAQSSGKKLRVELVKSVIGTPKRTRVHVRTMGLKRVHQAVILPDNGATKGMINKVPHLLKVTAHEE